MSVAMGKNNINIDLSVCCTITHQHKNDVYYYSRSLLPLEEELIQEYSTVSVGRLAWLLPPLRTKLIAGLKRGAATTVCHRPPVSGSS